MSDSGSSKKPRALVISFDDERNCLRFTDVDAHAIAAVTQDNFAGEIPLSEYVGLAPEDAEAKSVQASCRSWNTQLAGHLVSVTTEKKRSANWLFIIKNWKRSPPRETAQRTTICTSNALHAQFASAPNRNLTGPTSSCFAPSNLVTRRQRSASMIGH